MTHPVVKLEQHMINVVKDRIARTALWLLHHYPHWFHAELVMFSAPTPDASVDAFKYTGISFGGGSFFLGAVRHTPMQMTISKPRIVKP